MTTARAARIARTGGPDVIEWSDVDLPLPGEGEVLVGTRAVGLNYIDTYFRTGLYPAELPTGLGSEWVGVVEAAGPGVELKPGDRVGSFGPTRGAYATARVLPARELITLPDDVDDRTAAALLLKGCTTEFLVERCARVTAGQNVLVYAAAGVSVVFDGVGKAMWETSLAVTARRGLIVSFGNAGGAVTGVNLGVLASRGSLFVSRPTLFDYYVTPEERRAGTERLFAMLRQGAIRPDIGQTFALEDAADAHRALEAGETRGSTILLP